MAMLAEEELEMLLAQHHTEVRRGELRLFGRFRGSHKHTS